jgi:MoaA/NifB/PqqE/SkfB family radical SAM enzyme
MILEITDKGSMSANATTIQDECRPRLIVWQLMPWAEVPALSVGATAEGAGGFLTQHECLLVIDSIARLSKSILVLTGQHLTRRTDLVEIVGYGTALGLKMIVELRPEELSQEVLESLKQFGPRTIRIVLDGSIVEDMDTRYRQSPAFARLEKTVQRVRDSGYELHFSLNITKPDVRALSFNLDYAFRRAAKGLYCHLRFHEDGEVRARRRGGADGAIDDFIAKISELKPLLPSQMYFSPQCIKYSPFQPDDQDGLDIPEGEEQTPRWVHTCLAGRSFAFITERGKVFLCGGLPVQCGDLRACGFDFRQIWMDSPTFHAMREERRSCAQTRKKFKERRPAARPRNALFKKRDSHHEE